ncbi:hypothetical protein HPB50_029238 [Hyalomma asiaticum]|nr:hypothetical protein HPB50_029238 [Hyalomma asiaticum]
MLGLPPSPHFAITQCQRFLPSPPTFHGTTLSSAFRRQFESAAALCAWPEEHNARILLTQLRSPAAEFLGHLPVSDCTDYASLFAALETRYGDSDLRHFHLTELKDVRQGTYSLQERAAHVERFSWKALAGYPNSAAEFITTQTFIDAINDLDVQRFVRLVRPSTVHTALPLALECGFRPIKNIQWVQLGNFQLPSMGLGPVGFSPPIARVALRING